MMAFSKMGLLATSDKFLIKSINETGSLMDFVSPRMVAVTIAYFGTIYDQYLNPSLRTILTSKAESAQGYCLAREAKISGNAEDFCWPGEAQIWFLDLMEYSILCARYSDYLKEDSKMAFSLSFRWMFIPTTYDEITGSHFVRLKDNQRTQTAVTIVSSKTNSKRKRTLVIDEDDDDDIQILSGSEEEYEDATHVNYMTFNY
jgi:hypothetical protein